VTSVQVGVKTFAFFVKEKRLFVITHCVFEATQAVSFILGIREPINLLLREQVVFVLVGAIVNEVILGIELDASQHVEDVPVCLGLNIKRGCHVFHSLVDVLGLEIASLRKFLLLLHVSGLLFIQLGVSADVVLAEFVDKVPLVLVDLSPEVEV